MGNRPVSVSGQQRQELLCVADERCGAAASAIAEADVFILFSGAGFSADSGLAVYADVARVPAYHERQLEYHDICQAHWLFEEPELFWGFWGQCYNDYRETAPHEGYAMISRWAQRFRGSRVSAMIRDAYRARQEERKAELPDSCEEEPGRRDDDGLLSILERQFELQGAGALVEARPPEARQRQGNKEEEEEEKEEEEKEKEEEWLQGPYEVSESPGAFFAFTSNVDAHHFDHFPAHEIRECHGNTELYQCANRCHPRAVWRAPQNFKYVVDKETMLAPRQAKMKKHESHESANQPAELAYSNERRVHSFLNKDVMSYMEMSEWHSQQGLSDDQAREHWQNLQSAPEATAAGDDQAVPACGRVRGGGRPGALRFMTGGSGEDPRVLKAFCRNHPRCPLCRGPARPAVLMFGNDDWIDVDEQRTRWDDWTKAVGSVAKALGPGIKVAMLEIGAGSKVTTVRCTAEEVLGDLLRCGADARLFRVNPDMPFGDGDEFAPRRQGRSRRPGRFCARVISILGKGLDCIQKIDAAMPPSDLGRKVNV